MGSGFLCGGTLCIPLSSIRGLGSASNFTVYSRSVHFLLAENISFMVRGSSSWFGIKTSIHRTGRDVFHPRLPEGGGHRVMSLATLYAILLCSGVFLYFPWPGVFEFLTLGCAQFLVF